MKARVILERLIRKFGYIHVVYAWGQGFIQNPGKGGISPP